MVIGHQAMTASSVSRNRERQGRELVAGAPRLGRLHQWWTWSLYQEGPPSSANDVSRGSYTRSWAVPARPSSFREYRELEAGRRWPTFETWDRICKRYGWPQAFVG